MCVEPTLSTTCRRASRAVLRRRSSCASPMPPADRRRVLPISQEARRRPHRNRRDLFCPPQHGADRATRGRPPRLAGAPCSSRCPRASIRIPLLSTTAARAPLNRWPTRSSRRRACGSLRNSRQATELELGPPARPAELQDSSQCHFLLAGRSTRSWFALGAPPIFQGMRVQSQRRCGGSYRR